MFETFNKIMKYYIKYTKLLNIIKYYFIKYFIFNKFILHILIFMAKNYNFLNYIYIKIEKIYQSLYKSSYI